MLINRLNVKLIFVDNDDRDWRDKVKFEKRQSKKFKVMKRIMRIKKNTYANERGWKNDISN